MREIKRLQQCEPAQQKLRKRQLLENFVKGNLSTFDLEWSLVLQSTGCCSESSTQEIANLGKANFLEEDVFRCASIS